MSTLKIFKLPKRKGKNCHTINSAAVFCAIPCADKKSVFILSN